MKNSIRGFIVGVVFAFVAFGSIAAAAGLQQTIKVYLNSTNVMVNGKKLDATIITYNGTNYVPIKSIGEALGKDVQWNPKTNTVNVQDKVYIYDANTVTQKIPKSMVINADFDTHNLRYNAEFEIQVEKNIYWVPANALGKSKIKNSEIAKLAVKSPEEKQKSISNLYEALQLFQISNFREAEDNVRITEGNINWEHHKPGYYAVSTNEGCCATNSNWLYYILTNDYDEVGFVAYSQADGSGHVFNYIKEGEYYYVIDLTHYRTDFKDGTTPETGLLYNYKSCDFIAGNIHKVKSLTDYALYCRKYFNDPPELFVSYTADGVLPIDGVRKGKNVEITYPKGVKINVIFDDPNDTVTLAFAEPPVKKPDWDAIPSAEIKPEIPEIPDGSPVTDPDTKHKYQIIHLVKTWNEAQEYCKSLGGYLLTITTQDEYNFIMKNLIEKDALDGGYWIGGTEEGTPGKWRWVTGEPFNFTNWDFNSGEPNDWNGNAEDFIEMRTNGMWNDRAGNDKHEFLHFICEWDK